MVLIYIYILILYQEEGVFKSRGLKMETIMRKDEEIQVGIV